MTVAEVEVAAPVAWTRGGGGAWVGVCGVAGASVTGLAAASAVTSTGDVDSEITRSVNETTQIR